VNSPFQNEELKFPVDWRYKIIVDADKADESSETLSDIFKQNGFKVKPAKGNLSKNGKYITLKAMATFQDRESMEKLSAELSQAPCVRFLL
jgi:putative lipoic acid-binding regulatory protein